MKNSDATMARFKSDRNTERLNMRMSPEVLKNLERLQRLSRSENLSVTIRKALALFDEALTTLDKGGEIILRVRGKERSILPL